MSGHPLSRREFLGRAAVATGAFAGAAVVGVELRRQSSKPMWDESAFAPPGTANVAVVTRTTYDGDLTRTADCLKETFDLLVGIQVCYRRVIRSPYLHARLLLRLFRTQLNGRTIAPFPAP